MLEKTDLTKTADMEKFDKTLAPLKEQLAVLQRTLRDQKVPVIIVIEGWDTAGITMSTHAVIQSLDPRGFTLHAISQPTEEERARPFLWRFWIRTPAKGRIVLFARGWYSRAISAEMQRNAWTKSMEGKIHAINNFERSLADNGTLIIKFFLHIDKAEQRRRLEERERNPLTAWLVTPAIWNLHHLYDSSVPVVDDLLEKTDTASAPWNIIEATDRNYAILRIYSVLIKTLEKRVEETKEGKTKKSREKEIVLPRKNIVKRRSSPVSAFTREQCQETLNNLQIEMLKQHYLLFKRQIPLIIIYEGWDAAGKGGNITRIARLMNPLGYDVIPVAAPDQSEKDHHYLWRFIKNFPKAGHVAMYDRSWYGRVLVERVEKFCTETEWQRAYREINEMEEDYIRSSGGGIVKFWLEISKAEQLKRFQQRAADPLKTYKITDDDWRNRDKWDLYDVAVEEMLARTSTDIAPWTVIESNDKWYARVKALKTLIAAVRKLL